MHSLTVGHISLVISFSWRIFSSSTKALIWDLFYWFFFIEIVFDPQIKMRLLPQNFMHFTIAVLKLLNCGALLTFFNRFFDKMRRLCHGPLTRYTKLRVVHALRIAGTFSPPHQVANPYMHRGTPILKKEKKHFAATWKINISSTHKFANLKPGGIISVKP